MSGDYYVYEYIRLDYNEPFYIGKGKGNRWRDFSNRNRHFKNICKYTPVAVIILHDNLNEQTAFEYECWYIWYYRDILGYNLVNQTDGGEGGNIWLNRKDELEKWAEKYVRGKNNPMYGRKRTEISGKNNPMNKYPELRKRISEKLKGKNNPCYKLYGDLNPNSKKYIY